MLALLVNVLYDCVYANNINRHRANRVGNHVASSISDIHDFHRDGTTPKVVILPR
jgi:hypothetical protein